MARGKRKVITYTGKALKVFEKIQRLESELKNAREELVFRVNNVGYSTLAK